MAAPIESDPESLALRAWLKARIAPDHSRDREEEIDGAFNVLVPGMLESFDGGAPLNLEDADAVFRMVSILCETIEAALRGDHPENKNAETFEIELVTGVRLRSLSEDTGPIPSPWWTIYRHAG